jgi:hypothetical protein
MRWFLRKRHGQPVIDEVGPATSYLSRDGATWAQGTAWYPSVHSPLMTPGQEFRAPLPRGHRPA